MKVSGEIRVLVVDDSAFMRKTISDMLNSDPHIRVIDTATNGKIAIEKTGKLKPDVITMDVEMPEMDGLTALSHIMKEHPTPVIMLSAFTQKNARNTIKALESGAVDFIPKPSGVISLDIDKIRALLLDKVKTASLVDLEKLKVKLLKNAVKEEPPKVMAEKVVVIGASTGGPSALGEILPKLPGNIPAGLLIVQHMPPGFTKAFAQRMDAHSAINVKEAVNGDTVSLGKALIAPGDYHMIVEKKGSVRLNKKPPINGARPSIDPTMLSAANAYGRNTLGVILTGMGRDGTRGIKSIKENNGKTIAESESTCIVYGMPKAAVKDGCIDKVVPLHNIADEIMKFANS